MNNVNTNYESPILMGIGGIAGGTTTNLQSPNYLFNPLLSNQKIGPYEMFKSPP